MSSKGGGAQITGYRYTMAVHSGISRGPINEFCEIRVGELVAWGPGSITASVPAGIYVPGLFGGDEKEGGLVGQFTVYMGEPTQEIASLIVNNIEGGQPVPGWRGACTLFYYGQIGSNNPYPKPWKFRVRRTTAGWDNDDPWYPEMALIVLSQDPLVKLTFVAQPKTGQYLTINGIQATFQDKPGTYGVQIGGTVEETVANFVSMVNTYADTLMATAVADGNVVELRGTSTLPVVGTPHAFVRAQGNGGEIHAMNPAHIIYEAATNNVWGRGLPRAMIDDEAFRAAANQLSAENFGLCIRWNRDSDIDQFVQRIVDHIGAAIYVNRQTGLLTLKLIRKDYDAASLLPYTFENGLLDIIEDQTSSSDTMANEIIVSFLDPITDKQGQVRAQNLASFQSLGTLITHNVTYEGLATATLALRLAQRDLELNSSNLRRMTLKFTRAAWKLSPADVICVHAPSRGIDSIILRVAEVDEDPLTGDGVQVKAVEDVFGLPETSIVDPQELFWTPPDRTARIIADRELTEATYFDLADNLPAATIADVQPDTALIKVYARQPNGASIQYDLQTKTSTEAYVTRTTAGFDPHAVLSDHIGPYDTALSFQEGDAVLSVGAGAVLLIDDEYMRLDDIDYTAQTMTVARGVVDAIPAAHNDNAGIWFQTAMPTSDWRDYASSEEVFARLVTRTTSQSLDPALAYEDSIVVAARQGRPYPPGDMRVNTEPFATLYHPIDIDIDLTWTHRDRIVQGNQLLEHQAGSTGPEPGTTYTIRVYGPDQVTLLHTETGLTGTAFTYTTGNAMIDGNPIVMWFWIESVRGGYPSFQHYWFHVSRTFGFDEGFDYNFGS